MPIMIAGAREISDRPQVHHLQRLSADLSGHQNGKTTAASPGVYRRKRPTLAAAAANRFSACAWQDAAATGAPTASIEPVAGEW